MRPRTAFVQRPFSTVNSLTATVKEARMRQLRLIAVEHAQSLNQLQQVA